MVDVSKLTPAQRQQHAVILRFPSLVDGSGMVFDGSGEVRTGIEESWNSWVVLDEELDDC